MNIKKVDDKPMVIHTKEKAKLHTHETKNSSIKGAGVYTSERGTNLVDDTATVMNDTSKSRLKDVFDDDRIELVEQMMAMFGEIIE